MKPRTYILLFLVIDLLLLNTATSILATTFSNQRFVFLWPPEDLVLLLNASWIITYIIFINDLKSFKSALWHMLKITFQRMIVFLAIASTLYICLDIEGSFRRNIFVGTGGLFFLLKLLQSSIFKQVANKSSVYHAVIIGNNRVGKRLYNYLEKNRHLGYQPLGILGDEHAKSHDKRIIGNMGDFEKICSSHKFHHVFIALPFSECGKVQTIISASEKLGVRSYVIPHMGGRLNRTFKVHSIDGIPFLNIRNMPLDDYPNRFWKRVFDILIASTLAIVLMPVIALIALAIKLESRGPVFYRPVRMGAHGERFSLLKFRSMSECDDVAFGKRSTVQNDPRITRVGRIIRKYNLDELPQLFNVLNNDMSIVGPRPHRVYLNQTLQNKMDSYMIRHLVKPGITGWAQVNGWRGPTETRIQYKGRTYHDLWYLENWSLWLDIYIIFSTAFGRKVRRNAF